MAKAMVLALALPVLLMSRDEFADGEFPVLLLSSLYGVCLMQSADSFLRCSSASRSCRSPSTCWCCWPTGGRRVPRRR